MITVSVYFRDNVHFRDIASRLMGLPDELRPAYFTEDEGVIKKKNSVSDWKLFGNFIAQNEIGFFLYTKNKTCINLSCRFTNFHEVRIYLEENVEIEVIVDIFQCQSDLEPEFGFACQNDEYYHRNLQKITLGKNDVSSWIGRDVGKFVPGVYWCTFFSDQYLASHNLNIDQLSKISIKSIPIGEQKGSTLLVYYDNPLDWQVYREKLDEFCATTEGVFSRNTVDRLVSPSMTFLEYHEAISPWS